MDSAFSQLVALSSSSDKEPLQNYLKTLEKKQVIEAIPLILQDRSASEVIASVLEAYGQIGSSKNAARLEVFENVIQELIDGTIQDQNELEIVYMLGVSAQELPDIEFVKLMQFCIKAIQKGNNLKGKWLTLFPQLYLHLQERNRVIVEGHAMAGSQYAAEVVSSIRHTQIVPEDAVPFAAFIRELNLPSETLGPFVEKLCDTILDQPPQELPPLVYQLLFICDKTMQLSPIQQLAKYFKEKSQAPPVHQRDSNDMDFQIETTNVKELQQAKATSIFHIMNAASHGRPLAKELIKMMRKKIDFPESFFTPFIVEVALALGGIPEFGETIEVLKSFVQRSIYTNERRRHSAWVKEIVPVNHNDPLEIIVGIMDNNKNDWGNIVTGIELLGFALLEMKPIGKRPGFGAPSSVGATASTSATSTITTGLPALGSLQIIKECWSTGTRILLNLMKKYREVAPQAVKKLIERIEHGGEAQYIDTLKEMVHHVKLTLLECKSSLTGLLCNMDYQNVICAGKLFAAIAPLLRHAPALRDTATLILRKLIHSCSEEARQVAVTGFLHIMKDLRFGGSSGSAQSLPLSQWGSVSSQATIDVHQPGGSDTNKAFCTELLILLRACKNHQLSVKIVLYRGFPEVVSRNPDLVPGCAALLREQLDLYVDSRCGVKLEEAISMDGSFPVVIQPLGHLIQGLLQTLIRGGMQHRMEEDSELEENGGDAVEQAVPTLLKITKGLASSSPEDFQIDKSLDEEGLVKAQLLSTVCVAVMDFCVLRNAGENREAADLLLSVYSLYSQVENFIKESSGKAAKGKSKKDKASGSTDDAPPPAAVKRPVEMPQCLLSLRSIASLMKILYKSSDEGLTNAAEVLRAPANGAMHLWLLEAAWLKCRELRTNGQVENLSAGTIIKQSCSLARSLLLCCVKRRFGGDRETAIFHAAVESLSDIVHAFCEYFPDKRLLLLISMEGAHEVPPGVSLEDQIKIAMEHLQDILKQILSPENSENLSLLKAAVPAVSILNILSEQLDTSSHHFAELLDWTKKICKETESTNENLVKALLSFLVKVHSAAKPSPNILVDISKQIHVCMGDIEESVSLDPGEGFGIINEETTHTAMAVVCSAMDQLLNVADWVVPSIGGHVESSTVVQHAIYSRLAMIITALAELVQGKMALNPAAEQLLKTLAHLYTTIGKVTKQQEKVLAPKYEKLINHLGNNLSKRIPALLTHLEEANKSFKRKASGSRVQREAQKQMKCNSALVFALEQCSSLIMNLSKKSKVDLSAGFKLWTSRDFRIRDIVQPAEEEENNEESNNAEDEEPAEKGPAPKRAMFMRGRRGRNKLSKLGK